MKIYLENKTNEVLPTAKELKKIFKNIIKEEKQASKVSLGVFYVNEKEIQELNEKYREQNKATDVISFRLIENPERKLLTKKNFPQDYDPTYGGLYLGEIFICTEIAKSQAKEFSHSHAREVAELFVHGALHVLGYDHIEQVDAEAMKARECLQFELLDKIIGK